MVFTNISSRGIYLACCHREVAPGSQFVVPWARVAKDRSVRSAMRNGDLSWTTGAGDPEVPGSPALPDPAASRRSRKAASVRKAERQARVAAKMAADDAGVRANMAAMGRFDLPYSGEIGRKVASVRRQDPVLPSDVLADAARPQSLSDLRRHNKAVKAFGGTASRS